MIAYLDTSVIVSRLTGQSPSLASWGAWDKGFTSVLTRVEFLRTCERMRLTGQIDDPERVSLLRQFDLVWQTAHQIRLTPAVIERAAGSFPVVLGTLDALHLASALTVTPSLGEPLTFLTHDQQLGRGAESLGLRVEGT